MSKLTDIRDSVLTHKMSVNTAFLALMQYLVSQEQPVEPAKTVGAPAMTEMGRPVKLPLPTPTTVVGSAGTSAKTAEKPAPVPASKPLVEQPKQATTTMASHTTAPLKSGEESKSTTVK
jgi:hypothetical protein